jgi:hypothetical protein
MTFEERNDNLQIGCLATAHHDPMCYADIEIAYSGIVAINKCGCEAKSARGLSEKEV